MQRQPVARGDPHRGHRGEGRRVEPRPRAEQELRLPGLAVEEVGGARVAVVVERDDPVRLVGVLPGDARVAGCSAAHGLPVTRQALVEGVHHDAVAQIDRAEQLAGAVADDRPAEVDLLVAVDLALRAVGRIELHQAHQVAAARAAHPELRPVRGEGVGLAAVLVGELGHDAQLVPLRVAHQQLVVAGRRLGERRAQPPLAVGLPAHDVARVAADQLQAPGGQRQAVGVEQRAIAQVHRHEHVARGGARARRPARRARRRTGSGRGRGRRPRRPPRGRGGSRRRRCPACRGCASSRATTGMSARRGRGRR